MKFECLSKENLILKIKDWVNHIKKKEKICIEIVNCPILKGTFDLEIKLVGEKLK